MVPEFELTVLDMIGGLMLLTLGVGLVVFARWAEDGARPLLLHRMIARVGGRVDILEDPLAGNKLAAAARACARCRSREVCEAFLACGYGDDVPAYCPNRQWIAELPKEAA